jgi:hypothetical protein
MAHINIINVEIIYSTCGVFNSLNIKFLVSLHVIFLFLGTLTCALRAQVNMTLYSVKKQTHIASLSKKVIFF